jgi:hypothetical protein
MTANIRESQQDLEKRLSTKLREDIRADLRREVTQGQATLKKDIQDDLNREIQALGRTCTRQLQDLQQEVQATERGVSDLKASQGQLETRLQILETRGSDAGTVVSSSPPGRKQALVLGGWDPDTASEDMLEAAKRFVQEMRLDVDLDELFVPGVRRGFAMIPYGPRAGESAVQMRQRLQGALNKVKASNYVAPGRNRPVWLVYSRSPAERRRSALAGKTKRLILQLTGDGGIRPSLEAEWGSGTVWLAGMRVASAASASPAHADAVATGGWIDLSGIAQRLRMTREAVKAEWEPLAAQLR